MGLLDSVIGALGQRAGGGQPHPQAALINAIVAMLAQGGSGSGGSGAGGGLGGMLGGALGGGAGGAGAAAGGLGGLGGLVEQFARNGMGDIANSWVGGGQNLPVSPDQLGKALGGDTIGNLSRQLGMNQGDLLGQLSQLLPQVVDKLTPQGNIPQGDIQGMGGDLGGLLGGLLGGSR